MKRLADFGEALRFFSDVGYFFSPPSCQITMVTLLRMTMGAERAFPKGVQWQRSFQN